MTLYEYLQRFEADLEEEWNDGARSEFINWNAFVAYKWRQYNVNAISL